MARGGTVVVRAVITEELAIGRLSQGRLGDSLGRGGVALEVDIQEHGEAVGLEVLEGVGDFRFRQRVLVSAGEG